MPAKTTRKILKVGGSKTVALPPDWLRALELDLGDVVEVLYDTIVIIKPQQIGLDFDLLKHEWTIQKREVGTNEQETNHQENH